MTLMEIDSGSGNKNAHPTSTQQGRGCTPVAPRLNVVSGGEPRLSAKMGVYFSRRNGTRLGPLASSLNMGARAERTSRADGWAFLFPEPVLQNGGEGVNPVANVSCLFPWSLLPQGGRLPAPTETGRGGRGIPAVKNLRLHPRERYQVDTLVGIATLAPHRFQHGHVDRRRLRPHTEPLAPWLLWNGII